MCVTVIAFGVRHLSTTLSDACLLCSAADEAGRFGTPRSAKFAFSWVAAWQQGFAPWSRQLRPYLQRNANVGQHQRDSEAQSSKA